MESQPDRQRSWGVSLFCDDIRQEVGNKMSLMGLYQADMIFQNDFPLIIPRFGILVRYFETKGAFSEDVILKVFLPGDDPEQPTVNQLINRPEMNSAAKPYELDPEMEALVSLRVPMMFSPLQIKCEGFIKVRMYCGQVVTKLGALRVRKIREGEVIPNASIASQQPSSRSQTASQATPT
jgi:hypothetical protein